MRGNPLQDEVLAQSWGSIPAHAGQPARALSAAAISSVYPRACGATPRVLIQLSPVEGLSPRMRGNPLQDEVLAQSWGSIPAHAGQPAASESCASR